MKKRFDKKKFSVKGTAGLQIAILILSTISLAYMIGNEIGFVSAAGDNCQSGNFVSSGSGFNVPFINGQPAFCYGNPSYWFIFNNALNELVRSDGRYYTQNSDGSWNAYSSTGTFLQTVNLGSEGTQDHLNTFQGLATQLTNWVKQNTGTPAVLPAGEIAVPPSQTAGLPTNNPLTNPEIVNKGAEGATTPSTQPTNHPECWYEGNCANGLPTTSPSGAAGAAGAGGAAAAGGTKLITILTGKTPWDGALAVGGAILKSGAAAGIVYGVFALVKSIVNAPPGSTMDSILTGAQISLTAGVFTGTFIAQIFPAGIGTISSVGLGFLTGGITAIIAVAAYLIISQDTKQDAVVVQCVPWQPPYGGDDCSKCGQNGLPCTGYECASLGTACQLISDNITGQPICYNVITNGAQPVITFLGSALSSGYIYKPINGSSYPGASGNTGVLITPKVQPYTTLSLGITTDQPAKCIVSQIRGDSYDNMTATGSLIGLDQGINFDEGIWGAKNPDGSWNHTFTVPIFENNSTTTQIGIQQSGQSNLYIRCVNVNNVSDIGAYVIEFNVDQTPDVTPPGIISTTPASGTPLSYGITSEKVYVYTNEPVSGCRWSHLDQDYSKMAGNAATSNMSCSSIPNSIGSFTCVANLTGITNGQNNFYFRCNDTSGNVDQQSYPFSLTTSSNQLSIVSASPNQTTIFGSSSVLDVKLNVQTSGGLDGLGTATCQYDLTGLESDYQDFVTSNSSQSSTDLWLGTGNYTYYLKCFDFANDADYSTVSFNVQQDVTAPSIVRVYHDSSANTLNIQTNENATCVYDINSCNYPFESGTPMSTIDNITYYTAWVPDQTYYIKCQDQFGNQPEPTTDCSVNGIISPSSF